MTVQEAINELLSLCEGLDTQQVEIQKVTFNHGDSWPDYETPRFKQYTDNSNNTIVTIW
jgi:hypothetical protein